MNNIKQTYTTRELIKSDELALYVTDVQRAQFDDLGHLQTNSVKALETALEADFKVERYRGKWTLSKRVTGSLPPFRLDKRMIIGKTDIQLLILIRFNNYIAKLQRLADAGDAVVSKTITEWIVDADLMNAGITNMYQRAKIIGQLDNQVNKFYGHYSTLLNYQLRKFFFSQIDSNALGLGLKKVGMIKLIELDDNQKIQTIKLTDSELELVESYRQSLMSDNKYSTQFYKSRQLNETGREELNRFVYNHFACSAWWYEYQVDLSSFNKRAMQVEQENAIELIQEAFRAYRTEEISKNEYERPYYILNESLKLAMIEQRYFDITNQADALLNIAETDNERISELRQRYDDELTSIVLDRHSTDVFRLSDETIEAYEAGFYELDRLKNGHLAYFANAETKQMLDAKRTNN